MLLVVDNDSSKIGGLMPTHFLSSKIFLSESEKLGLGDLIYKTRSFMVHNYREITPNQDALIDDINYWFEKLIIEILKL